MKKILCLVIALVTLGSAWAQSDTPKSVEAYRKAKKSALPLSQEGTTPRNQLVLDSIASDLGDSQDDSFEFHLVSYMNSKQKLRDAYHLQQAMALSPSDPALLGEAIEYYGMLGDESSLDKLAGQLRNYGLYRNHAGYYKDMDLLMNQSDILFTNGETDTRPLLMQRSESNKAYEIIRITWLSDPLYLLDLRGRGINCPEVYTSPSDFIRQVSTQNPYRRVILSPTLNPELLGKFGSELVATGLGLSISSELDQTLTSDYEIIRSRLIEGTGITASAIGKNYIPLLRAARISYLNKGTIERAEEIKNFIHSILIFNNLEELEEQILK